MQKMTFFWRKGLWALLSLLFFGIICAASLWIYAESQLPDVESLKTVKLQVPLRIYSEDGQLIQEYGEKRRIPVAYKDIPQTLVHAVLATEDQRFFEHPGVDIFGLGRAAFRMLQTGTKSQGGSTITMQVARNFFLNRKKTFLRKFNEIVLAIKIDRELSKEKILELYLNKIYLGNRAYGVGAAAYVYYGKKLNQLTLAQLAMIAGLPQAPSAQNPIKNPKAAIKRRNHVLERLYEESYITEEQYKEAINEPVTARYHGVKISISAPYVAEMIRQSLVDNFGHDAYTKGYKVYTTINGSLQNAAKKVVKQHLLAYDKRHGYRGPIAHINDLSEHNNLSLTKILQTYPTFQEQRPAIITKIQEKSATALLENDQEVTIAWDGMSDLRPALIHGWVGRLPTKATDVVRVGDIVYLAPNKDSLWSLSPIPDIEAALVAMDPNDGAIKALVGGFDFQKSKFNRATQISRQPGSTIKPFIYAAALNKGYTLATLINDAPIVIQDSSQANGWRPHNVNRTFNGPTRLKEALIRSRNLVSIRILDNIGIDYAIDFLGKFGFNPESLPHGLSLALGALSVSPLELADAYAVFANGGHKTEPYLIERITDSNDQILLQAKPTRVVKSEDPIDENEISKAPRVVDENVAFLMDSALRDVVQQGTARGAKVLNRSDIGGKTGTTNDQTDAWFAGYTPDLVTTVWVGFDSPKPLHEYAAGLALPIWVDFMRVALKNIPINKQTPPKSIVSVRIDPKTGLLANENQSDSMVEYFREDEIPNYTTGNGNNNQSKDKALFEEVQAPLF